MGIYHIPEEQAASTSWEEEAEFRRGPPIVRVRWVKFILLHLIPAQFNPDFWRLHTFVNRLVKSAAAAINGVKITNTAEKGANARDPLGACCLPSQSATQSNPPCLDFGRPMDVVKLRYHLL
ncbi:hypothetical protein scyTo_0001887 [Scyliorhinus torazame]|uniref:Uncharacterized protein n=1 Tax=Scyliorhinus torazame TaxID=75743 RepID=A0A401PGK8_SCYTO|nr:hypothetical protein [Scyliorhinus torazame]